MTISAKAATAKSSSADRVGIGASVALAGRAAGVQDPRGGGRCGAAWKLVQGGAGRGSSVGGHRGALARARHDRGASRRARPSARCLIGMRIAHELQLDERGQVRALLRAAAQGRRLLVVGRTHVPAVRHRRHRAQDARQARRLDEARAGRALHLAARRRGRAHRARPAHALGAALAGRRGQGDRRDALRPRRRDRPQPRLPRRRAPTPCGRSTSTGTVAASRSGWRATRSRCSARIACLSQTAEVFFAAHGVAAAQEMVRERRGRWFDPQLADVSSRSASDDRLWSDLARDDVAVAGARARARRSRARARRRAASTASARRSPT